MHKLISIVFLLICLASPSLCSRAKLLSKTSTFSVLDYGALGDGQTDDSQTFLKAWEDVCGASEGTPTLIVPQDKTFLLKPLIFKGPCKSKNVHFVVLGNIVAPKSVDAWKDHENDKWIQFAKIKGLFIDGKSKGVIDGQGAVWWKNACNLNATNVQSCNISERPTALHFHDSEQVWLSGLRHLNSPRNHISVHASKTVKICNIHILAPEDSPNTDGIDISESSDVDIQNSLIQTGDDCVAINSGSSYINITGVTCGPGHGISVGSLGIHGKYQTVEEVHVKNCSFIGSTNGVRIKTWQGGSGYARKITFEKISFTDTKNPIIIDQRYCDGNKEICKQTSAVKVSDVTYKLMEGTSENEEAITLNCSDGKGCTNIIMSQVNITTSSVKGKEAYASCHNAHGTATSIIPNLTCLS